MAVVQTERVAVAPTDLARSDAPLERSRVCKALSLAPGAQQLSIALRFGLPRRVARRLEASREALARLVVILAQPMSVGRPITAGNGAETTGHS